MQESRSTELHRNGFRGIHRVLHDVQIECRRLPTLDLGIINKYKCCSSSTITFVHNLHHRSPPPSSVPASPASPTVTITHNHHPPPPTTTARPNTARITPQRHVTQGTSTGQLPHQASMSTSTFVDIYPTNDERCGSTTSSTKRAPAMLMVHHDEGDSRCHVTDGAVATFLDLQHLCIVIVCMFVLSTKQFN
jgi:hypothetical protein